MDVTNQQTKKRTIVDYHKLPIELKEQLKLLYSDGFHDELISYKDAKGQLISALRFETETIVYMIRMSKDLVYRIMDNDEDYSLKTEKKRNYMDKHADNDYLVYNVD